MRSRCSGATHWVTCLHARIRREESGIALVAGGEATQPEPAVRHYRVGGVVVEGGACCLPHIGAGDGAERACWPAVAGYAANRLLHFVTNHSGATPDEHGAIVVGVYLE